MDGQIPSEVGHDRLNRLLACLHEIGADQNAPYHDRDVEVLVEGQSKHNPGRLTGRTQNGKLVNFDGDPKSIGTIVTVHIDEAKTFSLDGRQIF